MTRSWSAGARPARWVHPGAWWLWALGLATAASRTTNPLYLILLLISAAIVVEARRPEAPWAGAFAAALRLGVVIVVARMLLQAIFGASIGTHLLFTLPEVPLPDWMAGVRIGGPVTAESLLAGFYDGLRLATLVVCIGAASSLASPTRLLKSLPAAIYELGVAVVVAMTFTPQLVTDARRISDARRLRGRPHKGLGGLASMAGPVFEGALERSVSLAAAMDSRGYGRTADVPPATRAATTALLLAGTVGVCLGLFGLLDSGSPGFLGVPVLVIGLICAVLALRLSGKRSIRTRYRPDPWASPEWATAAAGVIVAGAFIAGSVAGQPSLAPSLMPLQWPTFAPIGLVCLIALLPALLTPNIPAEFVRAAVPAARATPPRSASGAGADA